MSLADLATFFAPVRNRLRGPKPPIWRWRAAPEGIGCDGILETDGIADPAALETVESMLEALREINRHTAERMAREIVANRLTRDQRHEAFQARSDRARMLKPRPLRSAP